MPQLFNVIKCFQCSMYQVDINKKSTNKWNCKVCGAKQSLKQVFYQGDAKECRSRVQNMNKLRHEAKNVIDSDLVEKGVNFSKNYELFPKSSTSKFNKNETEDAINDPNRDGDLFDKTNTQFDENRNNLDSTCKFSKKELDENKVTTKSSKWAKYLSDEIENNNTDY